MMPSEVLGNSSLPVGDNFVRSLNSDGYKIVLIGGPWSGSTNAGEFYYMCHYSSGYRGNIVGGRLLYVPTANV
jgi:hypothetical protein